MQLVAWEIYLKERRKGKVCQPLCHSKQLCLPSPEARLMSIASSSYLQMKRSLDQAQLKFQRRGFLAIAPITNARFHARGALQKRQRSAPAKSLRGLTCQYLAYSWFLANGLTQLRLSLQAQPWAHFPAIAE